jgi:hypothetical protein
LFAQRRILIEIGKLYGKRVVIFPDLKCLPNRGKENSYLLSIATQGPYRDEKKNKFDAL